MTVLKLSIAVVSGSALGVALRHVTDAVADRLERLPIVRVPTSD